MKKTLLTISLGLAMLFTKAQTTGWVVGDGGLLRKTTDAIRFFRLFYENPF